MTQIDDLPPDRRAVLELLVKRGKSYDELAALLGTDPERIRQRASDALLRLGPVQQPQAVTDFLLGQQSPAERVETERLLLASPATRAWALSAAAQLRELGGGSLPAVPAGARQGEPPPLPERPTLTTPRHLRGHAFAAREREILKRQPVLGLAGLIIVVIACLLLGVAAGGGAQPSLLVLGPITTYALPVIAMIALWWEDWPGSSLRGGWAGLVDTLIVVVGALLLTMLGQIIVGDLDLNGIFRSNPGEDAFATFPETLPLAALAFTCMIHITFVWEGWPLRQLGRFRSGASALAISWVVAIVFYELLVEGDVVTPDALGAWLVALAAWQAFFFIGLEGWPFSHYESRAQRLITGNVGIIAGGWLSYLLLHDVFDWSFGQITAVGGSLIAAVVLFTLLFEGWPTTGLPPERARAGAAGAILIGTLVLYVLLDAFAGGVEDWSDASVEDWVTFAGLNFIAGSAILHVAVWERWPLPAEMMEGEPASHPA